MFAAGLADPTVSTVIDGRGDEPVFTDGPFVEGVHRCVVVRGESHSGVTVHVNRLGRVLQVERPKERFRQVAPLPESAGVHGVTKEH